MWNVFKYAVACSVFGNLLPSTVAAGLFGSLIGENDSNNNNPSIPLIGSLGIGSNRNEQNGQNNNPNQYTNNNQYANNNAQSSNNNNAYTHDNNVNRGLLSALGVNGNVNKLTNNLTNFNRYPNTGQINPSSVAGIKNQMKEAEKLLERLKELNRLKEQQKLEQEKGNGQGQTQPNTGKQELETDNNNVNTNGDGDKNSELKSLTKKKFYFMVKPVVPENEAANQEQTIYYTD